MVGIHVGVYHVFNFSLVRWEPISVIKWRPSAIKTPFSTTSNATTIIIKPGPSANCCSRFTEVKTKSRPSTRYHPRHASARFKTQNTKHQRIFTKHRTTKA